LPPVRSGRGWLAAGTTVVACLLALAGPGSAGAASPVQAYATNDAGGFRNVLPPGEAGSDNALQLAQFQSGGTYPPHFADQLPLYAGLIYASPTLTHAQIANYYKDATFGVPAGDEASTETPRSDVTIVRDKSFGVPHIYGTDRAGVMFGAGYAGAEDRLFLMDVLRHTGRAELSSFVGGAAGNRAMDATQWSIAPYTEADLQSQVDNATKLYGAAGQQVVDDVTNFVAGINAYVDAALMDPNKMPAEYAAIGKLPTHWTATDVIAEASLIGGIFGKGGGNELRSALTLQAFEKHLGVTAGRAAWSDFRSKNDPEAPTTLSKPFPYEDGSPFSTTGLAMPDAGSVSFISPTGQTTSASSAFAVRSRGTLGHTSTPARLPIPNDGSLGSQLLRSLSGGRALSSNWELVAARHSTDGHSIAVMGPQVGYYVPQILLEEDLHGPAVGGPAIDARGASFPGVNLYVELGHGRDYAWSATTATSDNIDTFAEVLCNPDGSPPAADADHYMYKGQCLPMQTLTQTNSWTPNADDQSPPGSQTLTAQRTVHGIVYARGSVNGGTRVAFVSARTTYFHEADSALGFSQLNDPGFVTSPEQFQQAASNINFGFNWAYVDADHIAYYHSGLYPQRAPGTSPDFPILGTGQYDWAGYDPTLHTLAPLPFAAHPNAIDPDYLVSWNNKQAPQWSAADDKYSFGPVYRSQMIEDGIKRALAGGRKMSIEQLVSAMDEPATTDIRCYALWPIMRLVLGTPSDPALLDARAKLDAWYADGCHRRDLTNHDISKPGTYQHNDAIKIMDAWYPLLAEAEFRPTLGDSAYTDLRGMNDFGAVTPGVPAAGGYPDFSDGWYGYISKDLRDLLARNGGPAAAGGGAVPTTRCRVVRRRLRVHGRHVTRRVRVCSKPAARHRAARSGSKRQTPRHQRRHRARFPGPAAPGGPVAGPYSRVYCAQGSLDACRQLLQTTLRNALVDTPAQLYGIPDCQSNPQASCYDEDTSTVASGISIPRFPWQNRPTFQQVVELTRTLPR
jgi:acyl-homoserine lactone acylase PvdQ